MCVNRISMVRPWDYVQCGFIDYAGMSAPLTAAVGSGVASEKPAVASCDPEQESCAPDDEGKST